MLLDAAVPVITGLSQGCTPIGPVREVTDCRGPWIRTLDRRPALAVLKEDIGEVLARDLRRIDGFVQAAIPLLGSDRADYLVRNLLGLDVNGGMIAIGEDVRRGDPVMFVKRDGSTAQADLRRMLHDLLRRTEGRTVRGALYHSCIARGPHMFGPNSGGAARDRGGAGPGAPGRLLHQWRDLPQPPIQLHGRFDPVSLAIPAAPVALRSPAPASMRREPMRREP